MVGSAALRRTQTQLRSADIGELCPPPPLPAGPLLTRVLSTAKSGARALAKRRQPSPARGWLSSREYICRETRGSLQTESLIWEALFNPYSVVSGEESSGLWGKITTSRKEWHLEINGEKQ